MSVDVGVGVSKCVCPNVYCSKCKISLNITPIYILSTVIHAHLHALKQRNCILNFVICNSRYE